MLFTKREPKSPGDLFSSTSGPFAGETERPAVIHHGMIGRGHVGKTALFRVLRRGTLQYELPSRLQFDVDDPTVLNGLIDQYRQTTQSMRETGLAQTVESEEIDFRLFEGDAERVVLHSAEVIGQVLTNTTKKSSPELKSKYAKYLSHLAQTDVTWIVISAPPQGARAEDIERYENDLVLTRTYLREALRLRQTRRPCSVAITLTKIDTLFENEEDARAQLTDEGLIDSLRPLIGMIHSTEKVDNAIICPVSAFGFGNAEIRSDLARTGEFGVPESGELEWILKEGVSPKPFNMTPLVLWTMLCGLLHQEVDDDDQAPVAARICRMLAEDMEALGGWYVPVKGPLTGIGAGTTR